jgi:hypothetical protein
MKNCAHISKSYDLEALQSRSFLIRSGGIHMDYKKLETELMELARKNNTQIRQLSY